MGDEPAEAFRGSHDRGARRAVPAKTCTRLAAGAWMAAGAVTGALWVLRMQDLGRLAFPVSRLPQEELKTLATVFDIVKQHHVDPVDDRKLFDDAMAGMFETLDPHSMFLHGEKWTRYAGERFGIGAEVRMEDGRVTVVSPIQGSPASRAGLKAGDQITHIDHSSVEGRGLPEVSHRLLGAQGTTVDLTVFRPSEGREFRVELAREKISMRAVHTKVVEPGYAWVRIDEFHDDIADEFRRGLRALYTEEPGLKGLTLDLRDDPGGSVFPAIAVAAAFLPNDAVIAKARARPLQQIPLMPEVLNLRGSHAPRDLPKQVKDVRLVVLVNGKSASASEMVAAALQDHGRATIMGARTFGKGVAQSLEEIGSGKGITVTVGRFYTPNGGSVQSKGVVPDVMLGDSAEPAAVPWRRESDLDRHIVSDQAQEPEDETCEGALSWIESVQQAQSGAPRTVPAFGSPDDFQLAQAIHHLKGEPVLTSRADIEHRTKADSPPDDLSLPTILLRTPP
jgi:carboxyl-terminal processing protease